jgi:hypothetical protein
MIEANANVILELISNGLLAHYGGEQGTVYYSGSCYCRASIGMERNAAPQNGSRPEVAF